MMMQARSICNDFDELLFSIRIAAAAQSIALVCANNPSAKVNDIMRDHPELWQVIKHLYHSFQIVSRATDPNHPLAGKTICCLPV